MAANGHKYIAVARNESNNKFWVQGTHCSAVDSWRRYVAVLCPNWDKECKFCPKCGPVESDGPNGWTDCLQFLKWNRLMTSGIQMAPRALK